MKVKINGKIFTVAKEENHRITIKKGLDDFDILFFIKWLRDSYNMETGEARYKKEYAKEIDYVSKLSFGTFIGCFPCELGEDYVILSYDRLESNRKFIADIVNVGHNDFRLITTRIETR
jgi:hypothetical protein